MADKATLIIAKLAEPFHPGNIHWRVGSTNKDNTMGIALAYIDARDAMERLDAVAGPANWQRSYPWSNDKKICCSVGVRIDGEWIWKSDGAGDTNFEADKGAFSDAFKRACVNWGIARYLYDLPNAWLPIQPQGRSYVFSKEVKQDLTNRLAQWQGKLFGTSAPVDTPQEDVESAMSRNHPENKQVTEMVDLFIRSINEDNNGVVYGHWAAFDDQTKRNVWGLLTHDQRTKVKAMLEVGKPEA